MLELFVLRSVMIAILIVWLYSMEKSRTPPQDLQKKTPPPLYPEWWSAKHTLGVIFAVLMAMNFLVFGMAILIGD